MSHIKAVKTYYLVEYWMDQGIIAFRGSRSNHSDEYIKDVETGCIWRENSTAFDSLSAALKEVRSRVKGEIEKLEGDIDCLKREWLPTREDSLAERQERALKLSIAHWTRLATNQRERVGVGFEHTSSGYCECCNEFTTEDGTCGDCPIHLYMGVDNCRNTPYGDANQLDEIDDNGRSSVYFTDAADREVAFLEEVLQDLISKNAIEREKNDLQKQSGAETVAKDAPRRDQVT